MKCPKCKGTIRGNSFDEEVILKCRKCNLEWIKELRWWKR